MIDKAGIVIDKGDEFGADIQIRRKFYQREGRRLTNHRVTVAIVQHAKE